MISTFVWMPVIFSVFISFAVGHPQCVDFYPPFESNNNPVLCDEYVEFGCCSQEKNSELATKYQEVLNNLSENGLSQCADFVKSIICQECSPYAAHIYDLEATLIQRPLPGLCISYCHAFYNECSEAVIFLTNSTEILNSLVSQDSFCNTISVSDMDYCYPELLNNDILNGNITREARTQEGCLCLEPFDRGLKNPIALKSPPDNSSRLFVVEQKGLVYIHYKNKTREEEPFLDLTSAVLTSARKADERGLLGFVFHPNYVENRKFYVVYSALEDTLHKMRVSEFLVSASKPTKAEVKSERVILEVDQPFPNHNSGEILFGEDGYLYCFLGDGGGTGDPFNKSQNKSSLLGKVLRIDVDSPADPGLEYHIPDDNPFVGEENSRPEIYAYGVRNTWRCDMDEGDPDTGYGKGRIICGDVGQSAYEEVDIIEKGGNFGWRGREGYECYNNEQCGQTGPEVLPIHVYPHSVGKSITGGHMYRGCLSPNLQGKYIFGDYVNGIIFTLEENQNNGNWSRSEITLCGDDYCFNGLTNAYEEKILAFGEDDDGEVYMLTTDFPSTEVDTGAFYRIMDPRRRGDPTQCRSFNKTYTQPVYPEDPTSSAATSVTDETASENPMTTSISSVGARMFSSYGWQLKWMPVTTCIMVSAWKCYHYLL